jgi:hypothetical protein
MSLMTVSGLFIVAPPPTRIDFAQDNMSGGGAIFGGAQACASVAANVGAGRA